MPGRMCQYFIPQHVTSVIPVLKDENFDLLRNVLPKDVGLYLCYTDQGLEFAIVASKSKADAVWYSLIFEVERCLANGDESVENFIASRTSGNPPITAAVDEKKILQKLQDDCMGQPLIGSVEELKLILQSDDWVKDG
jgi:hypothetical protein